MKLKPLLLLLAALPALSAGSGFHQVFERAALGTFDLRLPADLARFAPPERDLIESLYALGRLDMPAAESALQRYARRNDPDVERRRQFYSLGEDLALLQGQYARAADAGTALLQLPNADQQSDYQGAQQTQGVAQMLRAVPPVRLPGGVMAGSLPATRDAVGLTRVTIRINGQSQEVVVDTGASLSVVSATTAKRLGLSPLQGEAMIGSSVSAEVATQIAVARELQVGETRFESVVLLVLDDAQLTYPVAGGYAIPAILGFPELLRLGRLRFDDTSMRIGGDAPPSRHRNLALNGGRLYVDTDVAGSCVPLHLDTGANASDLTRLYADQHAAQMRALASSTRHLGGAGGISEDSVLNWPNVAVKVGDRQLTLPELDVSQATEVVPPPHFGTLGRDVLSKGYGLDFGHMQLWITGDTAASGNACERPAATPRR